MLVPTIHIAWCCSKNSDAMLDGLDHALRHTIALRPLRCSALMLDSVVLAHHLEFCSPFSTIVSEYKFGYSIPIDNVVFQESGCSLGTMISNCFCLAPLRIVVDGHQNVFVS
jgi:hypothetical protein